MMTMSSCDSEPPAGAPPPAPAEVAEYVAQMSSELAVLARRARFEMLAYLLEMVRIEAEHCAGQVGPEGE